MQKELEDIYYQLHWLFDQIALLEVAVRKLERESFGQRGYEEGTD